ncbi:MAG: hypothetical protein KJI69_04545 [Patescibacteria group bacterium]|nr:hypothetical protein [Patescibacteria group bacterium]
MDLEKGDVNKLTRSKRHDYILVNLDLTPRNLWRIHWDEQFEYTDKKHDGYAVETDDDQIPDSQLIRYGASVHDYLEEHGMECEEVNGDDIIFWRKQND